MAVVYKALDVRLDREVAIKVILPSKQASEKFVKRFEREARLLARLSHPNIVKILDYGTYEGSPYLVMEYIRGKTLKSRLPGNFSWGEAFRIVSSIARALYVVHRQKIIHRDIKPSNILMDEDGRVFVSDFGVAKFYEDEETFELTGTGVGVGTPEYMSPEQVMGHTVDARSDIYSLGILLYQLITQRTPFRADTPMAVGFKQVSEPLPRPKSVTGVLPDQVEYVLIKALAKKPEDRYQSMAEFASAMEKLLNAETGTKEIHHSSGKTSLFKTKPLSRSAIQLGVVTGAFILVFSSGIFLVKNWQSDARQVPVIPATVVSSPAPISPSLTPTSTFTAIPVEPINTNTNLPSALPSSSDPADMQWTFTDALPDSMYKTVDLQEGIAWLVGDTLDVNLRVMDIPEEIPVSQASISNDSMEYAWFVNIDTDGNGTNDYQAGIFVFKFTGSQQRNVSPLKLEGWSQVTFYKYDGNGGWISDEGTVYAEMDPVTDIIHIKTISENFTPDMILSAETYRDGGGGDSVAFIDTTPSVPVALSAASTPASPESSVDKSDIWNVEVEQSSSSEIIVNFEYQIESSIDLSDVWIGASPAGCYENISFAPVRPFVFSGKYSGVQGVKIWLNDQGTCNLDRLSVFIFSEKDNGQEYFKEDFVIPISLQK